MLLATPILPVWMEVGNQGIFSSFGQSQLLNSLRKLVFRFGYIFPSLFFFFHYHLAYFVISVFPFFSFFLLVIDPLLIIKFSSTLWFSFFSFRREWGRGRSGLDEGELYIGKDGGGGRAGVLDLRVL